MSPRRATPIASCPPPWIFDEILDAAPKALVDAVRPVTGACMFSYLPRPLPLLGLFYAKHHLWRPCTKKAPPRGQDGHRSHRGRVNASRPATPGRLRRKVRAEQPCRGYTAPASATPAIARCSPRSAALRVSPCCIRDAISAVSFSAG
jgi:hypothetical protein